MEEKEINRIEAKLREKLEDKLKKPSLPSGYFESFGQRLKEKLEAPEPKQRFLLNTWLLPLTAVASFALLALFGPVTERVPEANPKVVEVSVLPEDAKVENSAVEAVLEDVEVKEAEVLPQLDAYLLEEVLAESYQEEKIKAHDRALNELSNEQIEDYLLDYLKYSEL